MGVISGGLCGCLTGFSGIGGPPAVVYILASGDSAVVRRSGIVMISATVMGALPPHSFGRGADAGIVVPGHSDYPYPVIGAVRKVDSAPDRFFGELRYGR